MFERVHARSVLSAITAENLETTVRVEKGKLIISAKGGLTLKQKELASKFRDELVWYLMTPPESKPDCNFCGQAIWWICNKYGVWTCSCYYVPKARKKYEEKLESNNISILQGYWTHNRKDALS